MSLIKFNPIQYFTDVAVKHPQLLHTTAKPSFIMVSSLTAFEELLSKNSNINATILALEDINDGRYVHRHGENVVLQPQYSLYILKRIPANDHSARKQALTDVEQIWQDILGRMLHHSRNYEFGLYEMYADISFYGVGPIGNNYYGTRYTLSFSTPAKITPYNPNDWNE